MKILRIALSLSLLITFVKSSQAQWHNDTVDSLINLHAVGFDSAGLVRIKPNTMEFGKAFELYQIYFPEDSRNEMSLISEYTDPQGMTHMKYQQYNQGYKVEAAQVIEHGYLFEEPVAGPMGPLNSSVHYINGKVGTINEEVNSEGIIDKETALIEVFDQGGFMDLNPPYAWAWMDEDWENELKEEFGVDTSYHPLLTGKLVWAAWDYWRLGPWIPQENLRLAWRFELVCLSPDFHKAYYVDAYTGELFKTTNLIMTDGPATILHYSAILGDLTIDTKARGWPYNDFTLRAQGNDRNIHTKYFYGEPNTAQNDDPDDGTAFSLAPEIDDGDDDWGTSDQRATFCHWAACQASDYFSEVHGHLGTKGKNNSSNKVKIRADGPHLNALTQYKNNDQITIASTENHVFLGQLDVVAHEYTHGVIHHTADLVYEFESGALNESIADMLGTMTERYIENQMTGLSWDWEFGEDAGVWVLRDLQDPPSAGNHFTCPTCEPCENFAELGQPDTYEGDFWCYCPIDCDEGGVHVNSGVGNKWFSLLVSGGTHNGITVQGIGAVNAEFIVYNMLHWMTDHADYIEARVASEYVTVDTFGDCSPEDYAVRLAWQAVEVPGALSSCPPFGVVPVKKNDLKIKLFPNPSSGNFVMEANRSLRGKIEILNTQGQVVFSEIMPDSGMRVAVKTNLASGYYLVRCHSDENMVTEVLVISRE